MHHNRSRFGSTAVLPPTLRTALSALYRNKMRSLLTALGVIIGVGAVIAISEIGNGSKKSIEKSIASMGANNVVVLPGAAASGGVSFGSGSVQTLTPDDCDEIGRQCPDVVEVAPIVRARAQVAVLTRIAIGTPARCKGTTASFLAVRDWETLDEGDIFTDNDVRQLWLKYRVVGKTDQTRVVPERVAYRKRHPHPERELPRDWRFESQGRQHDGHGSGRHRAGAMDDDQISRQRRRRRQHHVDRGSG